MIEYIQGIQEEELKFISSLDYGNNEDKHLASLKQVIFEQEGVVDSEQGWFPYEVIELGSNWLQENHAKEFVICTLLVILNIEKGSDQTNDLKHKFETHSTDYDKLPKQLSEIILGAYENANF